MTWSAYTNSFSYTVDTTLTIYCTQIVQPQFLYYLHSGPILCLPLFSAEPPSQIFGPQGISEIHGYSAEIPCGSKILSKTVYLARFSRYKHFYVLQFLRKIRKFKMAAIFGETKFFFKIGIATLQRYPAGQKFCRNRSI